MVLLPRPPCGAQCKLPGVRLSADTVDLEIYMFSLLISDVLMGLAWFGLGSRLTQEVRLKFLSPSLRLSIAFLYGTGRMWMVRSVLWDTSYYYVSLASWYTHLALGALAILFERGPMKPWKSTRRLTTHVRRRCHYRAFESIWLWLWGAPSDDWDRQHFMRDDFLSITPMDMSQAGFARRIWGGLASALRWAAAGGRTIHMRVPLGTDERCENIPGICCRRGCFHYHIPARDWNGAMAGYAKRAIRIYVRRQEDLLGDGQYSLTQKDVMQRCGVTQMAFTTRVLMSVRADGVISAITLRHPNIRDFLGSSGNGSNGNGGAGNGGNGGNGGNSGSGEGGHGGGGDGGSVGWSASVAAKQAENTNAAGAAAAGAVGGGAAGHARRGGDGGGAGNRGGCSVHEEGREMETKAGGVGGDAATCSSRKNPSLLRIPPLRRRAANDDGAGGAVEREEGRRRASRASRTEEVVVELVVRRYVDDDRLYHFYAEHGRRTMNEAQLVAIVWLLQFLNRGEGGGEGGGDPTMDGPSGGGGGHTGKGGHGGGEDRADCFTSARLRRCKTFIQDGHVDYQAATRRRRKVVRRLFVGDSGLFS